MLSFAMKPVIGWLIKIGGDLTKKMARFERDNMKSFTKDLGQTQWAYDYIQLLVGAIPGP